MVSEELFSEDFLNDFVLEGVKARAVNGLNLGLESLASHLLQLTGILRLGL